MSSSVQTPLPRLATFDDLLAIPEDERFHEILDGELVRKLMPSFRHGLSQTRTGEWLGRFNRRPNGAERPGGWWIVSEVEIALAPHQIVRPDLAGWRRSRLLEAPDSFPMELRPDWICEVYTDGDGRRRDNLQKRRIYSDHGIPHYWLIDMPRRKLVVLRLDKRGYVEVVEAGADERVRAEPFEALEMPVGALFGDDVE